MHVHGGPNAPQGQLEAYNMSAEERDIYLTLPLRMLTEGEVEAESARRQLAELTENLAKAVAGEGAPAAEGATRKDDEAWIRKRIPFLQRRIRALEEFRPRSFDA